MNISAVNSLFSPAKVSAYGTTPTTASAAAAAPQASSVVTLSAEGRQAAQVDALVNPSGSKLLGQQLLLPTRANAAKLAQAAGDMISAKLKEAGIANAPSFELAIEDVNSAHVSVKGDRPDAKAIEDLINNDPALQMAVHNAYALASHVPAVEKAAEFSQAYTAAKSQAEIDQVLARYSSLLNGLSPQATIGLSFGKDGLTATINGEVAQA